ncbi:hypothetical protein SELMODRAFT_407023 [Selaginella moellendorffii]|uniref:Uncharacterized protein n=1 Tax=Selaginella moellendorffii TaxID=88036 RepID=D8R3N3_SELML|nr:hypothetical protein SELMODRAFT_407023 [Selaginella moellendorffii]
MQCYWIDLQAMLLLGFKLWKHSAKLSSTRPCSSYPSEMKISPPQCRCLERTLPPLGAAPSETRDRAYTLVTSITDNPSVAIAKSQKQCYDGSETDHVAFAGAFHTCTSISPIATGKIIHEGLRLTAAASVNAFYASMIELLPVIVIGCKNRATSEPSRKPFCIAPSPENVASTRSMSSTTSTRENRPGNSSVKGWPFRGTSVHHLIALAEVAHRPEHAFGPNVALQAERTAAVTQCPEPLLVHSERIGKVLGCALQTRSS